jgi:hypothetical protein
MFFMTEGGHWDRLTQAGSLTGDHETPEYLLTFRYQGETWMLDSLDGVCAGQARFEYPATSVLFSNTVIPPRLAPCRGLRCGPDGAYLHHYRTAGGEQRRSALSSDQFCSSMLSSSSLADVGAGLWRYR